MEKSDSIKELAAALAKAQIMFLPVHRSAKVDYTTRAGQKIKYSYAPLTDILDSCRKALSENGLAIMQPTKLIEGNLLVETLLCHSSGEWIKSEIIIEPVDKNPQSEGSALTYARRYSLSSLLGIAADEDEDAIIASDDGEKATRGQIPTPQKEQRKPKTAEAQENVPPQPTKPPVANPDAKQTAKRDMPAPELSPHGEPITQHVTSEEAEKIVADAYAKNKGTSGEKKYKRDPTSIKSLNQLLTACKEDFIMPASETFKELNLNSSRDYKGIPSEDYKKIAEVK